MNESAPTVPLLTLVVGDLGSFCCFLKCSIMNESAPTRPLLLLEPDRGAGVCFLTCSIMNESDTDFGEDRCLVAPRAVAPHRDGGFGTCETWHALKMREGWGWFHRMHLFGSCDHEVLAVDLRRSETWPRAFGARKV